MPTYKTSDGQRVEKSVIDHRTREAKKKRLDWQLSEFNYNFCEDCGRNGNGEWLDCSHEESVNTSQKEGRAELAWDWENNIKIRCRPCHKRHDKN